MAGCKPEYMPVVLGVLEAALDPLFMLHGLLCTTHFSGPLVIINGPVAKSIGMNSGVNALGQGNRANATIGRALQLIVRNVGGGMPGAIDRATLGNPGKYTFCFAEDEMRSRLGAACRCAAALPPARTPSRCSMARACTASSTRSRARRRSWCARWRWACSASAIPSCACAGNAVLVLSPEHYKIFKDGGWNRRQIEDALYQALKRPGRDLVHGAQGVAEGLPAAVADKMIDKFPPDGRADRSRRRPGRAILGHHRRLAGPARARRMPGRDHEEIPHDPSRSCAIPPPRPRRRGARASRRRRRSTARPWR